MRDLYFKVAKGAGNIVRDGVVRPCNFDLPERFKQEDENIIVIHNLLLDTEEIDDVDELLGSLYSIVTDSAKDFDGFDNKNLVICMYVNQEELKLIKERNKWGSAYTIDEENGVIMMYL